MADEFLRSRLYEYGANSNLVLEADRDRRRTDEGTGEVESLRNIVGTIKMGERVKANRPAEGAPDSQAKRPRVAKDIDERPQKEAPLALSRKGKNVLAIIDEIDSSIYQPKSRETRVAYEELLVEVRKLVGDQPQDILRGAANEVLELLKDNALSEQKRHDELNRLTAKSSSVNSHRLLQISQRITDFSIGTTTNKEEKEGVEEEMAVVFEDDDADEISDNDEDEDADQQQEEDLSNKRSQLKGLNKDNFSNANANEELGVHDIDAYWLQRQISKYYSDANTSSKIAEEALTILNVSDERVCENKLVALLDFDKFDLIKLLLRNRKKIYFCILLKQAQSEKEKQIVIQEMEKDASGFGVSILNQLSSKGNVQDWSQYRAGEYGGKLSKESQRLGSAGSARLDEEDPDALLDSNAFELHETLHLEDLVFQEDGHLMTNQRCELPEKSWRAQKKGYEEVHIPAVKPFVGKNEQLVTISSLPEWMQPTFEGVRSLNRVQSKLADFALNDAGNLLLCAPTGSGKTNVALLCMLGMIKNYRADDGTIKRGDFKIIYVAPMKALVQECVQSFGKRLQPLGLTVKELSGDQSLTQAEIKEAQVIITTPEKWDIITRKSGDRAFTQLVRLLIIDEVHLLHDERGPILEALVARTIRHCEQTQDNIRLVGLSATLPNYEDVAAFMRVNPEKGLFFFDSSYRPVPLQQQFIGITEKKSLKKVQIMNEICYEKILLHAGKNQVLIFTHSRADTVKTARALLEMAQANDTLSKFVPEQSASSEILNVESANTKNPDLQELIRYGFGVHHAGLARTDRTLVEDLFADKHLQVLVSTATLAWGVNLPCHTVIIKGTQIYSPEKGKWTELSPLDILQMMGRAGRFGLDSEGEGIILTNHSELQYYLSLMNQQLPIESHFIKRLPDLLNAEVVLGTISSLKEAAAWLGYTYLFVRMLRSSHTYGINDDALENDSLLWKRRQQLIHAAATLLEKRNLIRYDRRSGALQSTYIGRIASYYYVNHETVATFVDGLRPSMSEIDILRLLSLSGEFKNVFVRDEEKLELAKLVTRVPIPIKESVDEPSSKINVLLQSYISKLKLEGLAISADMIYVQQSGCRLLRALFEIALRQKWAGLAYKILELSIMAERKLWRSQSPLRQFTAIPEVLLRKLEKISDVSWDKYFDLSPNDFGEMIKVPKMGKTLYKFVHLMPKLQVDVRALPLSRSMLSLDVTCTVDFEFNEQIHGNNMLFWLMVEDCDGENILHYEPIIVRSDTEQVQIRCTVQLLDPLPPQYFIRIVSDRWLHVGSVTPVSFRHIILPEKFSPPTEVLDLNLLPISSFEDARLKTFFGGLKFLNSIQTQTYYALFENNDNVIVCAPTGSGKTLCAELAIIRNFSHSTGKAVYICPHQDLCEIVAARWRERMEASFDKVVDVLTGDLASDLDLIKQCDVIVATPEVWDTVSRKWKQRKALQAITLFVFDDLHLMAAKNPLYEIIVSRSRFIATQVSQPTRFVGLAYSLANARDLGEWLGCSSNMIFNFSPDHIPGLLDIGFQSSDAYDQELRINSNSKLVFKAVVKLPEAAGAILFVPNRKTARTIAIDLISFASNRKKVLGNPSLLPSAISITDASLAEVVRCGVGYIYEGQEESERNLIEHLYEKKALQVLIVPFSLCFSLKAGANLVGILDSQVYDGNTRSSVDILMQDLWQMAGRASQSQGTNSVGKCLVCCQTSKLEHLKRIFQTAMPLESHIDKNLTSFLLGEVVARTIENKADAVDYLTWTFFYRRLAKNPNFYGLSGVSFRHISDFLSEIVEDAINNLAEGKFVAVEDEMDVSALNLGMIASYYNLSHSSVGLIAASLTAKSKTKAITEIVSSADEFKDLPLRLGEEKLLDVIGKGVEIDPKATFTDNVHMKVFVILAAHFKRYPLSYEFIADLNFVLSAVIKLIHASVDVIASQGWLKPAIAAMELSQLLLQGLSEKDNALLQIPHFTVETITRLAEFSPPIESIFDFLDADDQTREMALKGLNPSQVSDVAVFCNSYPFVDISYELSSDVVSEGDLVQLSAIVKRDSADDSGASEDVGKVCSSRFPHLKQENWWLVLGDRKSNVLYAIKRFVLALEAQVKLEFYVPETVPGTMNLQLYLMCDSYIGCDQEYELPITVQK